ncbi:hypothetical protein E3C22_02725 [Jiella endophytica]|uniref:Glycosyl hydrolase n=1 Tax=Jiella endophytica TaxID=2558362 RepID=A0A4Y8RSU7_9HYPH|nr:hypothetical protein [Jiella endophytica]TFF27389.1 hypothetical protein E3C22_02725 [Jiella endophytica]
MRAMTFILCAAAVTTLAGAVPASAGTCTVLKRSELERNPSLAAKMQASGSRSEIEAGDGTVTGSTTTGTTAGGNGMSTSVTAGNGQVTTSNSVAGSTTTQTTSGTGAAAMASSTGPSGRTTVTASDGHCYVIENEE